MCWKRWNLLEGENEFPTRSNKSNKVFRHIDLYIKLVGMLESEMGISGPISPGREFFRNQAPEFYGGGKK